MSVLPYLISDFQFSMAFRTVLFNAHRLSPFLVSESFLGKVLSSHFVELCSKACWFCSIVYTVKLIPVDTIQQRHEYCKAD
jgi:hypothetical protein